MSAPLPQPLRAVPMRSSVLAMYSVHTQAIRHQRRRIGRPDLGEYRPDLVRYHLIMAREIVRRIREGDFGPDVREPDDDRDDDRGENFGAGSSLGGRHWSGRPFLSNPCGDA